VPEEDETMRRAIWIYNCEECMNLRGQYFCQALKKYPRPDKTGYDPQCPLPIVRGHFK